MLPPLPSAEEDFHYMSSQSWDAKQKLTGLLLGRSCHGSHRLRELCSPFSIPFYEKAKEDELPSLISPKL